MDSNVVSKKELGDLLRDAYMRGLSDGADGDDSGWKIDFESYSEFLERRREETIRILSGKFIIK